MEQENKIEESKYTLTEIVKEIVNHDSDVISLPLFVNCSQQTHQDITSIGIAYLSMNSAIRDNNKAEYEIFKNKYDELKETFYPELSDEELGIYLTIYMQFSRRYYDRKFNRDSVPFAPNLNNKFKSHVDEAWHSFCDPLKSSIKSNMSLKDRVRRIYMVGQNQDPDSFLVWLPNSYILTRIKRPTRMELLTLINNIELKLRDYGERYAVNSLNLERAGIAREIVDFFISLITFHSVSGLLANAELKNYILANDVEVMAISLLQASSPNGVYFNTNCLASNCKHSSLDLIDPFELYKLNTEDMEEDQLDFMYKTINGSLKSNIEEIQKYQNRYRYKGAVINPKYVFRNEMTELPTDEAKPIGEFRIKVPTLESYFTSFDLMSEIFNPTIKKYALEYPNAKEYSKKRSEFIGTIRIGEYVHWVDSIVQYRDPSVEGSEDVIESKDENQREFEQSIIDIFGQYDRAYWGIFQVILENTPYMTHSFIGITGNVCPSCKQKAGDKDKEGEGQTHPIVKDSGFTPIDPVMNFFDHTRMLIERLGAEKRLQEEITF